MRMSWNDIIKKLTSRKLWVALAGVATGIATIFGGDSGEISTIAGAVLSAASAIGYIVAEATVDKASVEANAWIQVPEDEPAEDEETETI